MEDFGAERLNLFLAECLRASNIFVSSGILGNKRSPSNEVAIVAKVLFAAEFIDIAEENSPRNPYQWILDSMEAWLEIIRYEWFRVVSSRRTLLQCWN